MKTSWETRRPKLTREPVKAADPLNRAAWIGKDHRLLASSWHHRLSFWTKLLGQYTFPDVP